MKYLTTLPLCFALLVGCSSDKIEEQTNTTAPDTAKPAKSGVTYKVVTTGKQPPFSYLDERGNVIGMDIDIIKEIAKEQGFNVTFDLQPWPNVFPSVVSGQNDLAISGISFNDERNEKYTLSKQYLFVPSAIMVTDPSINALKALSGKRFNCMTGAKQCNDIQQAVPTAKVTDENTTFLTFVSLAQGKTDAIGEDMQLLQYFAKKNPQVKVNIYPYEDESNPQSSQVIMAAKGKTDLINTINQGIDKLIANGKIKEIEKKWLDNPY